MNKTSAVSLSGSIASSLKDRTIQESKIIKQRHRQSLSTKLSTKLSGGKLRTSSERKEMVSGIFLQLSERRRASQKSNSSIAEKKTKQASQKLAGKEAAALAAQARKLGIAFLQLDLMPLLAGEHYTASRWGEKSPKLIEAYLGFAIDKPIMNEKHKHDLNPLIIRIQSAKCLPTTPVPIEELQRTCVPVYCKYTFYNMCPHQTQGRDHGTDVFFKDTNVILVGLIEPGKLSEYLRGPPLEVEVHDRDKKMENTKIKRSLFGEEPGDSKLSDISTVTLKYMVQNPIKATENIWSPYGVAKINLSNLLLGEKTLNFCAPIHNCSIQDTSLSQGENTSPKAKTTDKSEVVQLPVGHYVNAESYLKVRIEISVPLGLTEEEEDAAAAHCPYGCIIYLFDYKNTSLLHYLMQEITEINAEAFLLDSYPTNITQKSLNTLKLNKKLSLEELSQLDIITGFHIIDGSIHLLILEGFRNKALKRMWNKKIDRVQETKHGRLQIFYNSRLSFHKRLYINLEAILLHIRLCKPLSSIMRQPLLYIRDMIPQPCFEALSSHGSIQVVSGLTHLGGHTVGLVLSLSDRSVTLSPRSDHFLVRMRFVAAWNLHRAGGLIRMQYCYSLFILSLHTLFCRLDYICHSKKLREVIHCSLLPSAEMITMLSQEFGVPLTKADMFVQESPEILASCRKVKKGMRQYSSKLDNYNEEYVLGKREQEHRAPHNYIQSNIDYVNFLSEMLEREVPRTIRAFPFSKKAIFNYSCHTLNSAEIAKNLLRQEMAQMPGKRFAYNDYLSGMFDPVDEDSILKQSFEQSKKLWLYSGGFANPGFKSSIDANKHPRMPDEARLMELREKWQENFFNANIMKPVLDRGRWRWDKRDVDFELYKKPVYKTLAPDPRGEESE
ncbi:uncharacterized protein CFAP92 [Candoia aspera]|uniref:uncharacterized protein CFAP92 n=1 Tax=Candoia aspera TaxID=51853 RepID=UPI002FD7C28C